MLVPFITTHTQSNHLERRKGGGGGGKSSGGSGGTSKSGGSSKPTSKTGGSGTTSGKTASSSGKTSTVPLTTSPAGGTKSASSYGPGGGSTVVIPAGQLFAGRSAGGGMRYQVFGTRMYGSGYPGVYGRGVAGRGFPFWFWPVVWTGYGGTYLHASEYGDPQNTSRVGGPMVQATFVSNIANSTFHVLSDNSTISSLISSINTNCSSSLSSSSTSPQAYNGSVPGAPKPEQAVEYYRASSVVLTLDGYNNSATFSSDPNATDTPLPTGVDTKLLDCLNQTIGLSAPLVNGADVRWSTAPSGMSLLGILCLSWWILSFR